MAFKILSVKNCGAITCLAHKALFFQRATACLKSTEAKAKNHAICGTKKTAKKSSTTSVVELARFKSLRRQGNVPTTRIDDTGYKVSPMSTKQFQETCAEAGQRPQQHEAVENGPKEGPMPPLSAARENSQCTKGTGRISGRPKAPAPCFRELKKRMTAENGVRRCTWDCEDNDQNIKKY